jgi:predicted anti-sigma-YlaC factor YlaD
MNIDHHEAFQRMIDESLAGAISAEKEQSLREHLSTCATCREYLSASNRVIAGLSGFSFEVNPILNARVLAALRLQAEESRGILARDTGTMRQHSVPFKNWAAFAVALSMSFVGSALVYQVAKLLTVPMDFGTAQVQAGVLVFWLLPSFCSALCLLAAPGENRGIA